MRLAACLNRDVLKRAAQVLLGAVRQWSTHRAASKGAALSFYTLFSMAPVLVLVISIAGLFFGEQAARGEIFGQIEGLVGAQGAAAVEAVLAATKRSGNGVFAAVTAVALLMVGATTAFSELKDSLDELWDVPPRQQSGLWGVLRSRLLSFSLILVLAFLLLVSLIINAALAVVERFWGRCGQARAPLPWWPKSCRPHFRLRWCRCYSAPSSRCCPRLGWPGAMWRWARS